MLWVRQWFGLGAALLVAALVLARGAPAIATIQDDSCIYPDVEYPIPCDDDDD